MPFYTPPPCPPLKPRKIRSLKKWKKLLKISSFYTCVLKTTITWCAVPQIWSETDKTFCHLGHFFQFYPNNPQNQYFETMKKASGDESFYTCVTKITSCDIRFLRYEVWQTYFFILGLFALLPKPWKLKFRKNIKNT